MQLDVQALLNIVGGLLLGIGGWFARQLWDAVQRLTKDLHSLEVTLPTLYVRKDEFAAGIADLKHVLVRIEEKIDSKVDKP